MCSAVIEKVYYMVPVLSLRNAIKNEGHYYQFTPGKDMQAYWSANSVYLEYKVMDALFHRTGAQSTCISEYGRSLLEGQAVFSFLSELEEVVEEYEHWLSVLHQEERDEHARRSTPYAVSSNSDEYMPLNTGFCREVIRNFSLLSEWIRRNISGEKGMVVFGM